MSRNTLFTRRAIALALAGALAAGPAFADKRGEKGNKGHDDEQKMHKSNQEEHFGGDHRSAVRDYYASQFQSGRCPPGLAKKHNGCMPPGQAKKWEMNRPLPRDVVFYDVPRPLLQQLGQPPSGYRYIRVASDILMIAIGTSMVVDAIRNLGA
jgi:Ni/Co efflux regulator RcnB